MTAGILCIAGGARRDLLIRKPAHVAATVVRDGGAEATFVDLDFPLPICHGDLEAGQGVPRPAGQSRPV